MGDDLAGGVEVFTDVAVAVVGWVGRVKRYWVRSYLGRFGEHAADSACALWGAAEVGAPEAGLLKSGRDAHAPCVFCNAVPTVVEINRGDSVGGGGDFAAAGIEEVLLNDGACGVFDFGEAVFGIPNEGAVRNGSGGEWVGSGVSIEIINRRNACSTLLNSGVLVEGVRRVVGGASGGGHAVASFDTIADGVVLVGTIAGGDAAVCAGDLAEGVVTPEPAWDRCEGGAAGGDSRALANGIHGVVVTGNHACANFVLLGIEDVAGGFVGVGDGVDGAGDFYDEAAIREALIGEGLISIGSEYTN